MPLGGWKVEYPVGPANKAVFAKVIGSIVGMDYDPLVAATQVVNGENFLFIAQAKRAGDATYTELVKVYITASPAGIAPRLVNISVLVASGGPCGGWSIHPTVDAELKKSFDEAMHGVNTTISYRPLVAATQVVNGENYIFIAEYPKTGTPITDGLAEIFVSAVPAGANPTVTHIVNII